MSNRYAYDISELGIYIHFTQEDVDKFREWERDVVNPWMMEKWGTTHGDFIGGKYIWEISPSSVGTTIRVRTAFVGVDDNPKLEIVGVDVF